MRPGTRRISLDTGYLCSRHSPSAGRGLRRGIPAKASQEERMLLHRLELSSKRPRYNVERSPEQAPTQPPLTLERQEEVISVRHSPPPALPQPVPNHGLVMLQTAPQQFTTMPFHQSPGPLTSVFTPVNVLRSNALSIGIPPADWDRRNPRGINRGPVERDLTTSITGAAPPPRQTRSSSTLTAGTGTYPGADSHDKPSLRRHLKHHHPNYFAASFNGNWAKDDRIKLEDISFRTLSTVVEFTYADIFDWTPMRVEDEDAVGVIADRLDDLLDLLTAADRFIMPALTTQAEDELLRAGRSFIRIDNVLDIRTRAAEANAHHVMLGLEFDDEEWTSSFWNEGQSPINRYIGSQSAGPADQSSTAAAGDASRPRSCLQVLFGQVRPAFFLDEPWVHRQEPIGALNQFSMPTITLNDGATTDKTLSVTQPSVTSIGSGSSWSMEANKGVTYPSRLDDIMAGISF
ncbi:uncharacterized protein PAC_15185 [Phialocephala subalpina]|uniref:BTB domain-containing protein n=1 Tax=Phialocephala subalpina TaxID=576137 RepID=A0A1L7XJQ6_9HELO|nr:uncharacterized protein PAC_15185 [Phialocephala subalpina]